MRRLRSPPTTDLPARSDPSPLPPVIIPPRSRRKRLCTLAEATPNLLRLHTPRIAEVGLAKRRTLIPSARALLSRLEKEAGMYLAEDIRNQALRTVGE
ncbi:MAG: DUF3368 domain-containing protein [Verrucomicrobiales bacterium]|nr:DUF3368 domain-containing protein [Verrucomicrobiales bacterium]